jgi:hypothetical protein
MTDRDAPHSITDMHPRNGLDAAFATAFDRPLIASIRELIGEIIFQDQVRKHPERYPHHPRAAAILARAALMEELRVARAARVAKLAERDAADHAF